MNPKVVDYINKAKSAGKTDDEIREKLRGIGFADDEINEGLRQPVVDGLPHLGKEAGVDVEKKKLEKQVLSSANLFFWIAGLSVVNSLFFSLQFDIYFPVGLSVTQIIDSIGFAFGSSGLIFAFFLDLLIAGIYAVLGLLARKRSVLFISVGMLFYAFDGLLFLLIMDVYSIVFHLIVLFHVGKGLFAIRGLNRMGDAGGDSSHWGLFPPTGGINMKRVLMVFGSMALIAALAAAALLLFLIATSATLVDVSGEAVRLEDPNICSRLGGEALIIQCCSRVGEQLTDLRICDKAANQSCREACYTEAAVTLKSAVMCERIQDPDERGYCTRRANYSAGSGENARQSLNEAAAVNSSKEGNVGWTFSEKAYDPDFTIKIQPLEPYSSQLDLADVCTLLKSKYLVKCEVLPTVRMEENGILDSKRDQYGADKIISGLAKDHPNPQVNRYVLVAVTDKNIYRGDTNFVFSTQNSKMGLGVVSTYMFRASLPPEEKETIYNRRMGIQFMSTAGKVIGLTVPSDPTCALAYPNSLDDFNKKTSKLCGNNAAERDIFLSQYGGATRDFSQEERDEIERVYKKYYFE
jgi:predicted Zn-dependent protease